MIEITIGASQPMSASVSAWAKTTITMTIDKRRGFRWGTGVIEHACRRGGNLMVISGTLSACSPLVGTVFAARERLLPLYPAVTSPAFEITCCSGGEIMRSRQVPIGAEHPK
ncbi:hypothetical protein RB614_08205 [Phytohabitans sp. ZYX-F-186]|uniref:Uncharacterized protein n=1 Tax=Phytohabitans maris TaxID=3071409 RepID=A0ABU0ZDV7_9ACTN|nr:hypothetical protein [Phytohabitans sp. ZYX-F-186]MDQ7904505.1 hypothetical protein [Phytohabitans sp. ZYX-F-186]